MAAQFDSGMREVNTLIGGSEAALATLKEQVLAMSSEFGVAANEAVPALYQAISAGVPAGNAVEFLKVASTAAIGGVTDLQTSVDGLTTALNAYELPASQAGHVSDVLFSAVKAGKTDNGGDEPITLPSGTARECRWCLARAIGRRHVGHHHCWCSDESSGHSGTRCD